MAPRSVPNLNAYSVSMSTVLLIGSRVFCCCRSALSPPQQPSAIWHHLLACLLACLLASPFSLFALSIGGFCSKADFVIVGCRLSGGRFTIPLPPALVVSRSARYCCSECPDKAAVYAVYCPECNFWTSRISTYLDWNVHWRP